jgi:hypothetical protein
MVHGVAGKWWESLARTVGGLLAPILLALAIRDRHANRSRAPLTIYATIVTAFLVGGILSWNLIPFHCDMPFWTTIKASVDAETYGHPVEHKAEGILIWVLFGSVLSAMIAGAAAALAGGLWNRLRHSAV